MNDNPCVIFFCAPSSQEIYHPPSLTLHFEIPLRIHQNSLICACKSPLHSGNPYFPFLSNVERSLIPRKMLNLLYPWLLLLELRISWAMVIFSPSAPLSSPHKARLVLPRDHILQWLSWLGFSRKGNIFFFFPFFLPIAFIYLLASNRREDHRSTFWPLQVVTTSSVNYLQYSSWAIISRYISHFTCWAI